MFALGLRRRGIRGSDACNRAAYRPMLELLAYLRDSGFTTYIVSGGGIEFMRAWARTCTAFRPSG